MQIKQVSNISIISKSEDRNEDMKKKCVHVLLLYGYSHDKDHTQTFKTSYQFYIGICYICLNALYKLMPQHKVVIQLLCANIYIYIYKDSNEQWYCYRDEMYNLNIFIVIDEEY